MKTNDFKGNDYINEKQWDKRVPIFKNRVILKQLFFAIGIPFGLLLIVLITISAYEATAMVLALLALAYLFVMIFYKGTYDVRFIVNDKGITCENQKNQKEKVKSVALATTVFGLLAKNPTAAGAGALSGERTKVFLPWRRIRKAKYIDKSKVIMIYGGFGENIALFCEDDSYEEIKQAVATKLN
ncbi:MAG TPA: hypothetical protein VFD52_01700 [Clostridia bacterium]|nr:hypothetical protein [Clostridia bacterium]